MTQSPAPTSTTVDGTSETPPPATDTDTDTGSRWIIAATETRTAAKWMIGSLAAAGALIFGAGPIVNRPNLSWTSDQTQLIIALLAGTAGLISLVLLIGLIAQLLAPVKVTLESIPDDMRKEIDKSPATRLPSGSNSYDEFLNNYRLYKILVAKLSRKLEDLQGQAAPPDSEQDRTKQREQTQKHLQHSGQNLDIYTRCATSYLSQAEYCGISGLFTRKRPLTITLAVLAAAGALGFQLALASAPPKTKGPELAYLVQHESTNQQQPANQPQPADQLWQDLKLKDCVVGSKVPIILSGGSGSDDDPYKVTVLAVNDRCNAKSFDVRSDLITVEKIAPQEVTVHYQR
jgi:hypothetical protein